MDVVLPLKVTRPNKQRNYTYNLSSFWGQATPLRNLRSFLRLAEARIYRLESVRCAGNRYIEADITSTFW